MKNNVLLLLLFVAFCASAQETVNWNGKSYYVYPYQQEMDISLRNFLYGVRSQERLTRDSLNRRVVSVEEEKVLFTIPFPSYPSFKRNKKQFMEIRSRYPYLMYGQDLTLEKDIVPSLESLPDGEYVQYYRDLPYTDGTMLRFRNDVVCAVFSLKNNQLTGKATWYNAGGSVIKEGNFENGKRTGQWKHIGYDFNPPEFSFEVPRAVKGEYTDTTTTTVVYKDGLLNGPYSEVENNLVMETGFFTNNQPSGEWREYVQKIEQQGIKIIVLDETVLVKRYTIASDPKPGKSVIIRNRIVDLRDLDRTEYSIPYDNFFSPFSNYYSLFEEKEEEGLELPEEKNRSYPGEEMAYYDGYGSIQDIDFSYAGNRETYNILNKEYTRNDLIDSIGYSFPTEGVYEEFHRNGQLKMRFEVVDGKLQKEDTIFYDNGNPVSVVTYNASAKEYTEETFDYEGKLISSLLYDVKGNFLKFLNEGPNRYQRVIRGRKYAGSDYSDVFLYDNSDTLNNRLADKVLLEEAVWAIDSTVASRTDFDPAEGKYANESYTLAKDTIQRLELDFSDNYDNFLGTEEFRIKNLEARTILNGSYYQSPFEIDNDTLPSGRVRNWWRNYQIDSESLLYRNDVPYTGSFTLTSNASAFGFSESENAIRVSLSLNDKQRKSLLRAMKKAAKKKNPGKLKDYITGNSLNDDIFGMTILYNVAPFIGDVYEPVFQDQFVTYDYVDGMEKRVRIPENKAPAFDKVVTGNFLNGKPEGIWTARDQYGNITTKVNYINGVVQGEALQYRTAFPRPANDFEFLFENPILKDSLPAKPTYYLARKAYYKDGLLTGRVLEFNWMGDTISSTGFDLGMRQGDAFERTSIAYSESSFENDELDGISRTYLTLPKRDTIQLFDLNFQNGRLQGESKSFHLNGKLAKHGFFLGGEPIDDFEAFDTLGFKYQYVKFQFNQPVEEKIWEENQLSVRYTFDWRDSIYFNTSDIAGSQSLDELLGELGLNQDEYNQPYYGRPSLVDKSGINYHMTKYYPNDSIARDGDIEKGKKTGCWQFWNYEGRKLCEVDYFDTIITVYDSVRFKSKGILTQLDERGNNLFKAWIVEKVEKYDCAHTDHHEVRMLVTIWERDSSVHRMNGYVKNYYDNGVLQNEGLVKDGVATGVWKFYDPYGSLNMVGEYFQGKRNGRWLSGDLSSVKYMGDICLNPNMQDLEAVLKYQEKLLDISVIYYQKGVVRKREYYGLNLNNEEPPVNYYEEDIILR